MGQPGNHRCDRGNVSPQVDAIQIEDESKIELLSGQLEEAIVKPASEPVTIKSDVESVQQFFTEGLAPADKDDFDYLRKKKDSLSEIYSSYSQAVTKKHKAGRGKSVSEINTLNDSLKSAIEKELLDVYYKIGLNSDSELEKSEAIRFFKNYISRKESFHNDLAQKYLAELN